MPESKKIFVFDAYGTLFKVSSVIEGLTEEQKEISPQIQELWRKKQLEYTWLSNSLDRWADFGNVTVDALDYALKYFQVDDDGFRQSLLDIYKSPSTFPDVIPFLNYCKIKDVRTAVLSNGSTEKLQSSIIITGLKKYIDKTLSVNAVKVFKPDPKVYELVTNNFHCHPSDVAFFSSNAWDICGAKNYGFRCVWVNRFDHPFENMGFKPDKVVKALNQFVF